MNSLLIRAEDKNEWERRATITPEDLKEIIKKTGAKAYIQKSDKRFYSLKEYTDAGAEITSDMSQGDIIFGVKEIPLEKIISNKVYFYFSHTFKGQRENMLMLKKIMNSGSTLIDYEKITDKQGRRLVYFGPFAGDVGAIDILWLMGRYWKNKGIRTPFEKIEQALNYKSVAEAKKRLAVIGKLIEKDSLPPEISPMVIGILGYGNVSKGAQAIFNTLPVEYIDPDYLKTFIKTGEFSKNKIYISIFEEKHIVKNKNGKEFRLKEYFQHPENYENNFEPYLQYLTIIVNAVYWDKQYPKFVSWTALKKIYKQSHNPKLSGIADITCDVNGSIECNVKTTDSGNPAYLVNPITRKIKNGVKGDGIVILAVDNLPAELPSDSSAFFSNSLKSFIPGILKTDFNKPFEKLDLADEIKKAIIVYNGYLTSDFEYLEKFLK